MDIEINYLFKGVTIIAFLLLIIGIFAAWLTPTVGYEASIFTVTPVFYWIGFFFGIIVFFTILLAEILGKQVHHYLRIVKWILLAVCMISMTMLLTIRGFYGLNFDGDGGTHIGQLMLLLKEGTITTIYPNMYTYTATVSLLTSIEIIPLTLGIPALLVLIFIAGIFFAANEIFHDWKAAALSTFVACALPFGPANDYTGCGTIAAWIPYIQVLLVFSPYLLYVVFAIVNNRHSKRAFVILGCLLLISALFSHILAAVVFILFIFSVCVGLIIQRKKRGEDIVQNITSLLTIIVISSIGWITWTLYLNYIGIPLRSFNDALLGNTGTEYSEKFVAKAVNTANYDFTSVLDYAVKQFGLTGLLLLILFVSLVIIYHESRKGNRYLNVLPFFLVQIPFAGIAIFSLVSSVSFQPGRIVMFITIIGILFSGFVLIYLLYNIVRKSTEINCQNNFNLVNIKKSGVRLISILLFTGLIVSLFGLGSISYYCGPEIYSQVSDNTKFDESGMEFYFEKGSAKYVYNTLNGYVPYRWASLIYGADYTTVQNSASPLYSDVMKFDYKDSGLNKPYHNYNDFTNINMAIDIPGYLIIGKSTLDGMEISSARNVRSDNPYWLSEDTMHLKYDNSAASIYGNGEFDVYIVH